MILTASKVHLVQGIALMYQKVLRVMLNFRKKYSLQTASVSIVEFSICHILTVNDSIQFYFKQNQLIFDTKICHENTSAPYWTYSIIVVKTMQISFGNGQYFGQKKKLQVDLKTCNLYP